MPSAEAQTRSHLTRLFGERGLNPRRDLGQNFLIDLNLIEYILRQAELSPYDVVLEVGTGTGGLTGWLAQRAAAVVSVEYDRNVHALAAAKLDGLENLTLLQADALKNKNRLNPDVMHAIQQRLDAAPGRSLKLIANLPYNVATPVIANLVATDFPWTLMVVTVQHELALRMTAGPSTSHFGGLAVWLQAQCRVEILKKLPPSVFWPQPQVHSAIVRIEPHVGRRSLIADRSFFHAYVRNVFLHRRKQLGKVLPAMFAGRIDRAAADAQLARLSIGSHARAEELAVAAHVELANALQLLVAPELPVTHSD
jgi:16S rRNA (adenine1518-N6/adenine1519-N6)-dimethyltransferase